MSRPRILLATSFPPPMTGQNLASAAVRDWLRTRADVVVADASDPRALDGAAGWLGARARALRQTTALWRHVRTGGPYDALYLVLSSTRLGRLRDLLTVHLAPGARVIGHVQVGDFAASLSRWPRLSQRLLARLDVLVALSPRLAGPIRQRAPAGLRVAVVPNPAPGMAVSAADLDARRRDREGAPTLRALLVANALPGKGHDALLEGLAAYGARAPERPPEADVVGTWPDAATRRRYESRAAALGLAVRVHGAVADRARLRDLYLRADVAVLPSRYAHEGLPLALVEALATGTPIVASDHAAIPDLVTPETGVLIADERPDTLAAAFADLADPRRWRRRSEGARRHYEARYAPGHFAEALREAFGSVLS